MTNNLGWFQRGQEWRRQLWVWLDWTERREHRTDSSSDWTQSVKRHCTSGMAGSDWSAPPGCCDTLEAAGPREVPGSSHLCDWHVGQSARAQAGEAQEARTPSATLDAGFCSKGCRRFWKTTFREFCSVFCYCLAVNKTRCIFARRDTKVSKSVNKWENWY